MIFMLFSIMWGRIRNKPPISNILFTKHDHELAVELFLNSIKSKRSPKIIKLVKMSWYHKNLRRFHVSLSCTILTTSSTSSRNHETSSDILRFASIVRDNLRETCSNFYHSLPIWYHDILTSFMIFGIVWGLSESTSLLLHTVRGLSESDRPAPSDDGLELEMQNYIADN